MVKNLGALRPVDESGEEAIRSLGQGEIIEVTFRRPRNTKMHRLFWALMSLVWDQLDHKEYPTVETLVTRVKIATGHRDEYTFDGGVVAFVPRSIAFHAMDQPEFERFFEAVCDWVVAYVLPGVSRADLLEEIEVMVGIRDRVS